MPLTAPSLLATLVISEHHTSHHTSRAQEAAAARGREAEGVWRGAAEAAQAAAARAVSEKQALAAEVTMAAVQVGDHGEFEHTHMCAYYTLACMQTAARLLPYRVSCCLLLVLSTTHSPAHLQLLKGPAAHTAPCTLLPHVPTSHAMRTPHTVNAPHTRPSRLPHSLHFPYPSHFSQAKQQLAELGALRQELAARGAQVEGLRRAVAEGKVKIHVVCWMFCVTVASLIATCWPVPA